MSLGIKDRGPQNDKSEELLSACRALDSVLSIIGFLETNQRDSLWCATVPGPSCAQLRRPPPRFEILKSSRDVTSIEVVCRRSRLELRICLPVPVFGGRGADWRLCLVDPHIIHSEWACFSASTTLFRCPHSYLATPCKWHKVCARSAISSLRG